MKIFQYKSKYAIISENGLVFSKKGEHKYYDNGHGYITVSIWGKRFYVHRLVCLIYNGKPENENLQVNHINGIKSDNRACNLEWCSASYNCQHAYDILKRVRSTPGKGIEKSFHKDAKTINQIDRESGKIIKVWGSLTEAAIDVGRAVCSISDALNGRSRTCAGYIWEYSEFSINKFKPRNMISYEKRRKKNKGYQNEIKL